MGMSKELVMIDSSIDRYLKEQPSEAVRLILQEYQIAYDKQAVVAALAAKLVTLNGIRYGGAQR
jgi:hypothetical protein